MQDLSFDFKSPRFSNGGFKYGINVYTFENVYTLDQEACSIKDADLKQHLNCNKLSFAGGQRKAEGTVDVLSTVGDHCVRFFIEAKLRKTIRCVKLSISDLPLGEIVNLRESRAVAIPDEGLIYTYPSGWRGLYTPLLVIRTLDGKFIYFRSLDNIVREKRFAILKEKDALVVELMFEETGAKMSSAVQVPLWEIGYCESVEEITAVHQELVENSYHLTSWETRKDIPVWAREISLIASIHMQHWTGYTFNDYQDVVEKAKWLTERIDPKRILVYLPGWDGRYYWKYGHYEPDESMGGDKGFRYMMSELKKLGVRTMLMVGMNIVNRCIENFEQWGSLGLSANVSGGIGAGSVDWDGSRHYMHNSNAILSPGAPGWQTKLVEEVTYLYEKYQFDGMFLDIAAAWTNETNFDDYQGISEIIRRIKENIPDLLISGEGWYDAMSAITPLVQSGHTDGVLHWHDEPYGPLFDHYTRAFAHLCLGDPGRGSTGVHELGYNPIQESPLRKGIIPMVTIVEDTIETCPEGVEKIINDAKEYAKKYL
jgi:hypothetical protein